jgi:hypothetical protein
MRGMKKNAQAPLKSRRFGANAPHLAAAAGS